jgi:hypothetical protein
MQDCLHMTILVPLKYSMARVIGYVKGKNASIGRGCGVYGERNSVGNTSRCESMRILRVDGGRMSVPRIAALGTSTV